MKNEIQMIPISEIRIVNPRYRDRKKFETVIESIRAVGLKKPIQVSKRGPGESPEPGYDLVCGQGRIEAFIALGHEAIPAIVVSVGKEDRLLRSLIENMARRFPSPWDLIQEIERLKNLGHSNVVIGRKLGMNDTAVGGFVALKTAGEERLLHAALHGKIPMTVAIAIAKTGDVDAQRALLKGFESKQLNGMSIRAIKRLMDQRQFLGKSRGSAPSHRRAATSTESLMKAYRKECARQKSLVKKAQLCEARIAFFVSAFKTLFADETFVTLLRAEGALSLPKPLSEKIAITHP